MITFEFRNGNILVLRAMNVRIHCFSEDGIEKIMYLNIYVNIEPETIPANLWKCYESHSSYDTRLEAKCNSREKKYVDPTTLRIERISSYSRWSLKYTI